MQPKRCGWLLVLILALLGAAAATPARDAEGGETQRKAHVSLSTSGVGGTFNVAGTAIAALVSAKVPGLEVAAEVTRGVVENARLLASRQTQIGFLYGSTGYNLMRGLAEFKATKYEGVRGMVSIHTGALNFVTLDRTGIKTLDGLAGKRVSIGPKGSGSAAVAEDFLRIIGLFDKIQIRNLSFGDSASALRDGHIDAFVIGGTTPVPVLLELEASHRMVLLPVEDARRELFLKERPYHVEFAYPQGVYKAVTQPMTTVGYSVLLGCRDDVPEWVVYEMLKAMFSEEGKKQLVATQAAFREMSPGVEIFRRIELPLHPGAAKLYREQGALR